MDEQVLPGIEIVSTPLGDAPLKVRQAWIGLILPLHETSFAGPESIPGLSVFAASTGVQSWFRWLFRRPYPETTFTGYIVPSAEAIRILGESAPAAADWWRRNVPAFLHPEATFLFDADCCRPIGLQPGEVSRES